MLSNCGFSFWIYFQPCFPRLSLVDSGNFHDLKLLTVGFFCWWWVSGLAWSYRASYFFHLCGVISEHKRLWKVFQVAISKHLSKSLSGICCFIFAKSFTQTNQHWQKLNLLAEVKIQVELSLQNITDIDCTGSPWQMVMLQTISQNLQLSKLVTSYFRGKSPSSYNSTKSTTLLREWYVAAVEE